MRGAVLLLLMLVLAVTVATSVGAAQERAVLRGVVARAIDGDSLVLESQDGNHSIRLSEIDAPELDQPHGAEAGRALRQLAQGRSARVIVVDKDRYGRLVADVWIDGASINREMVRLGHAWAYTRYARSVEIIELEDEARRARRGLWKLDPSEREAPWEWRRRERESSKQAPLTPAGPIECGKKTRCAQMQSCEEARGYLRECGVASLDGDLDGEPCEALCR